MNEDGEIFSKNFGKYDGLSIGNACGGEYWESSSLFLIEAENNKATLDLKISSNTDNTASWAVGDYFLSIAKCNSTCLSCKDEKSNSCLSCYPYAELDIIEKTCKCIFGYYMELTNNCEISPCSVCKPCHFSCSSCSGANESDCVTCSKGFNYLIIK